MKYMVVWSDFIQEQILINNLIFLTPKAWIHEE